METVKKLKILFVIFLIIVLLISLWMVFSKPILRALKIERGIFSQDMWDKGVFINAENNNSVIINLGPVEKWRFFLGKNEVKGLAYFLTDKQENLVISIKDSDNNLVDIINLNKRVKPGDIVTFEWNEDNLGECKPFKLCIYHHTDYTFEKIPIFINSKNPFIV